MSENTDQIHTPAPEAPQAEKAVPVKSAKDAINAMYASDASTRLSTYLANSAKEIINASSKPSNDRKSAANLHGGSIQRSMESSRPSASGLLRPAKTEPVVVPDDTSNSSDPLAQRTTPVVKVTKRPAATTPKVAPVVRTSLKLGPKRSPIVSRPQSSAPAARSLRPAKTALNITPSTPSAADLSAQAIRHAAEKSIQQVAPSRPKSALATYPQASRSGQASRSAQAASSTQTALSVQAARRTNAAQAPRRRGLMQDIVRPPRSIAPQTAPADDFLTHSRTAADTLPADSVKHRFQAAPRGYAVAQASPQSEFASYVSDEHQPIPARPPRKPAVEIYGLMEDEPDPAAYQPAAIPATLPEDSNADIPPAHQDERTSQASSTSYASPAAHASHASPADNATSQPSGSHNSSHSTNSSNSSHPDNNRYALGGQSPFFLKSVNVEKRPLSDAPTRRSSTQEGSLYQRPSAEPVSAKNHYEKKKPREKKPIPNKPTVIIPSSRRSRAPLILLIILTIVLGAAVGALTYFCFFQ